MNKMPFINIAKTLLVDYNYFDFSGTRYEHWKLDETFWVYMFANHYTHVNFKMKVNIPELLKEKFL